MTNANRSVFAEVWQKHVIDPSRPTVLSTLGMAQRVFADATPTTRCDDQQIAPCERDSIRVGCGPAAGMKEWNVAIVSPNLVRILGKSGPSLQKLPEASRDPTSARWRVLVEPRSRARRAKAPHRRRAMTIQAREPSHTPRSEARDLSVARRRVSILPARRGPDRLSASLTFAN
jgi:hypothetical protein